MMEIEEPGKPSDLILKAIAGFRGKVASKNRTLGVPGGTVPPKPQCNADAAIS